MQGLELRVPPAVQVAIAALAMWSLSKTVPAFQVHIPGAFYLAAGLAGAGVVIALLGVAEFRKAQTTVDPRVPHKSASLVVDGVYRLSRNPMYVGFLLVLLGWGCYLGHALSFLLLPLFVAYMNRFQISPEEKHMREKFRDEFQAYAARVRRWI